MKTTVTTQVGGKEIQLETGRLAKQSDGSVLATQGNNIVLATVVSSRKESGLDFFPLTVEYSEKFYSTGKIPGGYFKREGRPANDAILVARLIDRPLRPKFPEGYGFETQVIATVLSCDNTFPIEVLASLASSAAVHISDVPFDGPVTSVKVGRINGQFILNPSAEQLEKSDIDSIVAASRQGILMVEGESKFVSEADVLAMLKFAHESMLPLFDMQDELKSKVGKAKRAFGSVSPLEGFKQEARGMLTPLVHAALRTRDKQERYDAYSAALEKANAHFLSSLTDKEEISSKKKALSSLLEQLKYEGARSMILDEKARIDGRSLTSVRPIACEVGLLPRVHGSGLFTRGETQVLGTVTLGTGDDEQMVDTLAGTVKRRFMLHYNFPPYSVGEVGRFGGQSRREIGHGFLAERAIKAILPDYDSFPYTVRVVSEVFESNGSSSMGTVCSGALALLDAGVPVKGNVAGIAMGLIKEGDRYAVLTDILGDEDHLGDMDFKVAGTRDGITSFQMDIKIDSINLKIMEEALTQAKQGRVHILAEMEKVMSTPRGQISEYAPRIETIKIKPEKIREVIGAGGKVIKSITEETGVKIDIEDDGTIHVAASDPEKTRAAIRRIMDICEEATVGKVYQGKVVSIKDFGAFVEVLPNTQGLLHISEIAHERVRQVSDILAEGDVIEVKVMDIDRAGRIKLSRKAILDNTQQQSQ